MKLVIDRSKWIRGEGHASSKLLRERDEKMCCLGFYCRALDVPRNYMLEEGEINFALGARTPAWLRTYQEEDSQHNIEFDLYEINDDTVIDDAEREAKIIELFKLGGIEVEFVN